MIEHDIGVVGTLLTIVNGVEDRVECRIELFFEPGSSATADFVVGAAAGSLLVKAARGSADA